MEDKNAEYKSMRKDLNLTNADVAEIIGIEPNSVKTLTARKKDPPNWAKGMVYVWKRLSQKED